MKKHFPGKRISFAYESGPTGYGLHDRLLEAGYPCLVVASSMIPVARGSRVKTNRLDSKKIAEGLRGGQLKGIRVPSSNYRALRHLTQLRNTFVRQCAANKCRIKALLLVENLKLGHLTHMGQMSCQNGGLLSKSCSSFSSFFFLVVLRLSIIPTYSKTKLLLREVAKDVSFTVNPFLRQKLILSKSNVYLSTALRL